MAGTGYTIGVLAETVGAAGLATLVVFTAISYGHMPARIATQFDLTGAPKTFAPRSTLWLVALVGAAFFVLLSFLNPALSIPGGSARDVSTVPIFLPATFAAGLWLVFVIQWTIVRAATGARPNVLAIVAGAAVLVFSVVGVAIATIATKSDLR